MKLFSDPINFFGFFTNCILHIEKKNLHVRKISECRLVLKLTPRLSLQGGFVLNCR